MKPSNCWYCKDSKFVVPQGKTPDDGYKRMACLRCGFISEASKSLVEAVKLWNNDYELLKGRTSIMSLLEVRKSFPTDIIEVRCNRCNVDFHRDSVEPVVQCPKCGIREVWTEAGKSEKTGNLKVMESETTRLYEKPC